MSTDETQTVQNPTPEDFIRRATSLDEAAHEHSRENYAHFRRRAFTNRQIARDLQRTEAES